jgi:hypothetical protein
VDPIDSTGRFLAQIRSRVAAVARQSAPGAKAVSRPAPAPAGDAGRADVEGLVLRRVLAIDPDDPERQRKAFRIFLESVLTDELGVELINDPAFHRVVDTVQKTMEQDAALLPAIEQAGEYLLQTARAGGTR